MQSHDIEPIRVTANDRFDVGLRVVNRFFAVTLFGRLLGRRIDDRFGLIRFAFDRRIGHRVVLHAVTERHRPRAEQQARRRRCRVRLLGANQSFRANLGGQQVRVDSPVIFDVAELVQALQCKTVRHGERQQVLRKYRIFQHGIALEAFDLVRLANVERQLLRHVLLQAGQLERTAEADHVGYVCVAVRVREVPE